MFVIRRINDNMFVAPPGQRRSYTRDINKARLFNTREEAERERCVGNEYIDPCPPCMHVPA